MTAPTLPYTSVQMVPIAQIYEHRNDRQDYDPRKIAELAASIHERGIDQPPAVHDDGGGRLELIFGHRRWRAFLHLGHTHMPAIVKRGLSRQEIEQMKLAENEVREPLSTMERARAYQVRLDQGWSIDDIARCIGKVVNGKPDRKWVRDHLKLLNLIDEVQVLVGSGHLAMSYALCMVNLDSYRQTRAVRFLETFDGDLPALTKFRRFCGELQAAQDQQQMFDLHEVWVERLQEQPSGTPRERRTGRPMLENLPPMPRCGRISAPDAMLRYAEACEQAGYEYEARVITTMLDRMLANGPSWFAGWVPPAMR
jgi:ParB/RepB/Spo0J family partition protein